MQITPKERRVMANLDTLMPMTSESLHMRLVPTIAAAKGCGWVVNVAFETGGEFETITFSARRRARLPEPEETP